MSFLISSLIFIFGTIIGSFLNVVICRYNTGRTFMGRSFCFSCRKKLTWQELFPVFSFIFQRGRCRACNSKISSQYMGVELLTGVIFFIAYWKLGTPELFLSPLFLLEFVFHLVIFSILIVITVYDLKHKIIPDMLSYSFAALAFLALLLRSGGELASPQFLLGLLSGILFFGFFALLWLVSRGRWIGFGDAKLGLGIGFFLGPSAALSAFLLAFWSGAIVSLVLLALDRITHLPSFRKQFTIKSEIPFAPFLILGLLLAFLGIDPIAFFSL